MLGWREHGLEFEPPTLNKIKKAIKELEGSNVAEKDELMAKLFKQGSEQLYSIEDMGR